MSRHSHRRTRPDIARHICGTWTTVSVRYGDLDPNGHVNNGAINQYFEDGRVGFRSAAPRSLGRGRHAVGLCRREICTANYLGARALSR